MRLLRKACLAAMLGLALVGPAAADVAGVPGARSPDCRLDGLGDRPPVDLAALRGRVVLVDFWASWCAPCAHAFGYLNALSDEFEAQDFVVVGVNVDADPAAAFGFLGEHPARFTLAADPEGRCPEAFGLWGMPTAYLIDRDGVIRSVLRGFRPGEADALRETIAGLVGGEHRLAEGTAQ